jgi:surfeit locus 1 family protein
MFSLTRFSFRFTLLTIFALTILVGLGVWQINRAHEKQKLLDTYQSADQHKAIAWNNHMSLPSAGQLLMLRGTYLTPTLLLDNQHYQHQFGYDAISPFLLENGEIILIDRGWVEGDRLREKFVSIPIPQGKVQLSGIVYYPSSRTWTLGQEIEVKNNQLVIIERINAKNLSLFLHKSVYPFIIRLDAQDPMSYVREWPIVAMPPSRHYGYALQWFVMALVVLVIYLSLNLKKKL